MKIKRIMHNSVLPMHLAVLYRSLLWGFVNREVRGRFAGTVAGIFWALVHPLAIMLLYMFVFSVVIRIAVTAEETGTDSFFIYFISGFVPWMLFSDSVVRATGSLVDNASLITKVSFPVELLPITSVLSGLAVNGIAMILMLVYLYFHEFCSPVWIALLLLLPLQTLFTLGLGMLFSAACVFLRDIREIIGLVMMFLFFSTPIIYPISMVPDNIQGFITLNPLYFFVTLYRDILLINSLDWKMLTIAAGVSCMFYLVGALFFARVKPGFGDVL